ncbi:hypothetical protein V6N13_073543 [Hibiscus sabdariffa]
MIRCCMCENWFHEEHISLSSPNEIPRDEEGEPLYEDFICKACSAVCSFLTLYPKTIWAAGRQPVAGTNGEAASDEKKSIVGEGSESNAGSSLSGSIASSHATCVLAIDWMAASLDSESRPVFLSKNWRDALCKCDNCLDMYKQKHISYLLDKEDSIAEYEKRVEKLQQREGAALDFFNNLGHIEKMEILNGIADFKDEFRSFLVWH